MPQIPYSLRDRNAATMNPLTSASEVSADLEGGVDERAARGEPAQVAGGRGGGAGAHRGQGWCQSYWPPCASRSPRTNAWASPTPSSRSCASAATWSRRTARSADAERDDWAWASEAAARDVAEGRADQAVVCCWTGTGASIAANKVPGVRAALCLDAQTADGARKWNDANALALSLRATSEARAGRDPRRLAGRRAQRGRRRRRQRRAPARDRERLRGRRGRQLRMATTARRSPKSGATMRSATPAADAAPTSARATGGA